MEIGKKLKEIRLFQGKSQKEMIAGNFDRSFYSRIESGQNDIAAEYLIKILQKNNISVVDFFSDFGDAEPKNRIYQAKIEEAYVAKNINELKEIKNDPNFTNQVVKKMIELLIAKLECKSYKYAKLRDYFKKYIYDLNKWDENSLWMLAYSMFIYNFSDLEGIVDSIFKKYQNIDLTDKQTLKLLAKIAVDYLNICLNKKKLELQIKETLTFLDKLPDIDEIALYKMYGVFYRSMRNKDIKNCETIIEILNNCGYSDFANMMSDELDKDLKM